MSDPRSRDTDQGESGESPFAEEIRRFGLVLEQLTRRKAMAPDEAEEFRSWALVRFLDDDCAVLRGFRGKSSLTTYLRVVAHNALRDYRIAAWGKWRPSAAARRAGAVAVRLEQFVYRDGVPAGEAFRRLRENHGATESEAELEAILATLPRRYGRARPVEAEVDQLSGALRSDAVVEEAEKAGIAQEAADALAGRLREMESEDRLLLRLRFEEGLTVANISRSLGLEQKPLYRRFDLLLQEIREALEACGCGAEEIRRIRSWHGLELSLADESGSKSDVASVLSHGGQGG